MKRYFAMFLLIPLLLTGCGNRLKEPVTFYYIHSGYEVDMSSVLGSEQREASGHREDLSYLMALYLMGPADEELQSPIPSGVSIVSAEQKNNSIIVHLSESSDSMTDAQYTLACSCLTLTCLEITDAEYVTINSGDRSLTLRADSLLLQDLTTGNRTEES